MKIRSALIAAAAMVFALNSTASAKVARAWNDLAPGPRVLGYNVERDEVLHQDSVVSVASRRRPGGDHAYSGNRLEAYRFRGKKGRGGIYDALEDYKVKFDPRKYQYRNR